MSSLARILAPVRARMRYRYEPLNSKAKEVRLLKILPAMNREVERLELTIFRVSLEEVTGLYFALSYTWGDPKHTSEVWLNGHKLQVTANLESALRRIRSCDGSVLIWADAICINQEDLDERSQQVLYMREIYSGAREVIAWIGLQESDREEIALDFVQELGTRFCGDGFQVTEATSEWIRRNTSPGFETCAWMALCELLQRPWFDRIWIVQEVVMPENVTMLCGGLRMNIETLLVASMATNVYLMSIMERAAEGFKHREKPKECAELHAKMDALSAGLYKLRTIMTTKSERSNHFNMPPPPEFFNIVRRFSDKAATDPRDKLYALLGIADPSHQEIQHIIPNYKMPVLDAYLSFARAHFTTRKTLNILNSCCGPNRPHDFPSWLIHPQDRLLAGDMAFLEVKPAIVFRAGGQTEASFSLSSDARSLRIKGVLLDDVHSVGLVSDHLPEERIGAELYTPESVRLQWADMVDVGDVFRALGDEDGGERAMENSIRQNYYTSGGSMVFAFMKTTLMDSASGGINSFPYFPLLGGIGGEPKYAATDSGPDGMDDEHQRARFGTVCTGRRFFVTMKGYIGLALPEVSQGDSVCVFLGTKIPFVVRPEGDHFLLIGEAYVQGMMNGEAIQELESGKLELTEIEVR
ncbi:hypothetical protein ACEPPN_005265 [Leptodophora sp. 'Broadleaf-Isolate-01']